MRFKQLLLAICLLSCSVALSQTLNVIDDAGNRISLSSPAKRIISLSPDLTEILCAIDAAHQIVGVVSGSDFPKAALKIDRVGTYSGLDIERILLLHPDLIVTWHTVFSRQLQRLTEMGIPVYMAHPKQLEDVARTMENMGQLTGHEEKAHLESEKYLSKLAALKKQFSAKARLKVFYLLGGDSLMTINKTSWINQAITLCGGDNLFAEVSSETPVVGWESVLVRNPTVIISDADNDNWRSRFEKHKTLFAVRNHFLYTINPNLIDRAGPRLIEGVTQICAVLDQARTVGATAGRPYSALVFPPFKVNLPPKLDP